MHPKNVVTTARNNSIGTSFETKKAYFVSTVSKGDQYETVIKAHMSTHIYFHVLAETPIDAVINHVATSRMATSLDENDWRLNAMMSYKPNHLLDFLNTQNTNKFPNDFSSDYCQHLLRMSGLNYVTKHDNDNAEVSVSGKPGKLHQFFYLAALIFGGSAGYRIGNEAGGLILGIAGAIFGAGNPPFFRGRQK